jgi:hypothetical protein
MRIRSASILAVKTDQVPEKLQDLGKEAGKEAGIFAFEEDPGTYRVSFQGSC